MNSPSKRVKCSHDAWFPIPPHDVLEVNCTAAVFDWKHADGFYMEVMIQGGVWADSIARLGLQYCCVVFFVVVPVVGFTSLAHTGRRLGS